MLHHLLFFILHVVIELQYDVLRIVTKVLPEKANTADEAGIFLDPDLYTDEAFILDVQSIYLQIGNALIVEKRTVGVDLPIGEQAILVQRFRPPGRVELPFSTAQISGACPRPHLNIVDPEGDITRPIISIEGSFRARLKGEVGGLGIPPFRMVLGNLYSTKPL